MLVWSVSDCASHPFWRVELLTPGFEGASPAEVIGQVLGGDAVEAVEPLLEVAVISVDVFDMQVRHPGGRLSPRGHGVKGDLGPAHEGGQRLAAIPDEMI